MQVQGLIHRADEKKYIFFGFLVHSKLTYIL